MSVELLWMLPIGAVAVFFYLVALYFQRRAQARAQASAEGSLLHDVAQYNAGAQSHAQAGIVVDRADRRMSEIEDKIGALNSALSEQYHKMEKFQQENSAYVAEVGDLRKKLRGLQKEYDIVLSENYSLRAKVKSLKKEMGEARTNVNRALSSGTYGAREVYSVDDRDGDAVNLRLYDDTRNLEIVNLEDTGTIDVSELR